MGDERVLFLRYGIEALDDNVQYSDALTGEWTLTDAWSVQIESQTLTATPQQDFETIEDARRDLEPTLRAWEASAEARDRRRLKFKFRDGRSVRPNQPGEPATQTIGVNLVVDDTAHATVHPAAYPAPPSDFALTEPVETTLRIVRKMRRAGGPDLAEAYHLLTYLQAQFGAGSRATAAKRLGLSRSVLDRLAQLASVNDPARRRKVTPRPDRPLTDLELTWIDQLGGLIAYRVGQVEAGAAHLPQLTMGDLPPLDDA